jgi:hypothetical protein
MSAMVGGMTLDEPRGQSETRAGRDSATLADRRYSDPEHGGTAGERRQRNSFEGSGNREDVALPDSVFHPKWENEGEIFNHRFH